MTDPSMTSDLIARLEQATEGSRELDAVTEVEKRACEARDTGLTPDQAAQWRHLGDGWVGDYHTKYMAPHYTTSIDAALTLVDTDRFWARIVIDREFGAATLFEHGEQHIGGATAEAATAALALCIAALKARSSNGER